MTDNYGNTALSEALTSKHYDLAKYIYKHGGHILLSQNTLASKLCYMVKRKEMDKLQV